jgi:hypothetical protein
VAFVLQTAAQLWEEHRQLSVPRILPSADGSVDLHWVTDQCEMLMNVPARPDEPGQFYADDGKGQHQVRGTFDPRSPNTRLLWRVSERVSDERRVPGRAHSGR